jgi:hypothetical protein
MKIISKYKDYYDYLIGIYGEDPKLIFDRRDGICKTELHKHLVYKGAFNLFIGNKLIQGYSDGEKCYYGTDIEQFHIIEGKTNILRIHKNIKYIVPYWKNSDDYIKYPLLTDNYEIKELRTTIYNPFSSYEKFIKTVEENKKKYPIFLEQKNKILINPKLEDLGINKVIDAHTVYELLVNWHSDKITQQELQIPPIPDSIKIQNAGFDLKTSFRK